MNEDVAAVVPKKKMGMSWRQAVVMESKSGEQEWRSGDAGWSTRDARSGSVTHH